MSVKAVAGKRVRGTPGGVDWRVGLVVVAAAARRAPHAAVGGVQLARVRAPPRVIGMLPHQRLRTCHQLPSHAAAPHGKQWLQSLHPCTRTMRMQEARKVPGHVSVTATACTSGRAAKTAYRADLPVRMHTLTCDFLRRRRRPATKLTRSTREP